MKLTILWEDSRGANAKTFGPHELLLSCLEDDKRGARTKLKALLISQPKKGNGGVLAALQKDLQKLSKSGPIFAVLDRDKTHELWSPPAPNCISGTILKLQERARGEYETILLIDNVESLLNTVLRALDKPLLEAKPDPNARDSILQQAAYANSSVRGTIRRECPSFDRLVRKVAAKLPPVHP